MKNVIEIDMLNNCACNLISNVNDGTNSLVLSIKCNVSLNPELVMQNKTVPITTNPFVYEIKESDLIGDGNIVFYLLDNEHMGNNFTIAKALSSGNLYLKRVTDFIYKLQAIKTSEHESIDLSDYYTKTEVDEKIKEIGTIDLSNYYTKEAVDSLLKNPTLKAYKYYNSFNVKYETGEVPPLILAVSEELEAGTWFMNFRVRFREGIIVCPIQIFVGDNMFQQDNFCYTRHDDTDESISFSSIITNTDKFIQKLALTFISPPDDESIFSGEIFTIVNAIKIA